MGELGLRKLIVDIQVHDLDRAVDFYSKVLELPLIHKDIDWASFETFGAEIHLYLHGGAEYGVEFRVVELEKEVEALKTKGVKFFIEKQINLIKVVGDIMEFPWGKAACFRDSEGNQITLVEDQ